MIGEAFVPILSQRILTVAIQRPAAPESFAAPRVKPTNMQKNGNFFHALALACLGQACSVSNPAVYGAPREAAAGSGSSGQGAATWVRQHQQLTHLGLVWMGTRALVLLVGRQRARNGRCNC